MIYLYFCPFFVVAFSSAYLIIQLLPGVGFNIPIVALCQVSRDAEGNEPTLAQLRGSGSIEQDADVVMFIHRERKKQEDGEMQAVQDAKLIVAKQRNGPIGDVPLLFLSFICGPEF